MGVFRRVWRGEARLWVAFWIWGVGGNMAWLGLLVLVVGTTRLGTVPEPWAWPVYLASLAWFVFVSVAIWRSAGRYEGPRVWAVLARAGVLVGVVRMAAEAAVLVALTFGGR